MSLYVELKQRRVFRALVGYGIAAFAVLQIMEPIMHGFRWPDEVLSYVVVALAVGFPIVVSLAWIFDVNAGRVERTVPAPTVGLRGARLALVLIGIGVLAAAPGTIWYFFVRGSARPTTTIQTTDQPRASIAVLAFADMSPGKDQEYFSDGIAEEILNALAHVEGLRVIGRTSSFSFKGKNTDLRTIGRELSVGTVLEGSVRKAGEKVRITTQLINATDGAHLWSETYDRNLADVFAVQDEIAKAVVEALKLRLVPGRDWHRRVPSPEVYNEYLLGKQFFSRLTLDNNRRAAAAYERAVAMDPEFALAWAGLALATFRVTDWSAESAAALSEGFDRAMAQSEKAVALDPELAEGYAARGGLRGILRWDWEGARVDVERALALNPGSYQTHLQYALVLSWLGRFSEAIAEGKKATDLDPLSAKAWGALGFNYYAIGQLAPAQAAFAKSLRIAPEQDFACDILLFEKRPAEALAATERLEFEGSRLQFKALALHDLGRTQEAQRLLDELIAKYADTMGYNIASAYSWFGDRDRAFQWLDRARAKHDDALVQLKADPFLRNLHGDPRWTAFLKKMNLPVD